MKNLLTKSKLGEKEDWILYQKFLSDIFLLNSKFRIEKFNIKSNLKAHFIPKIFLLLDKENKNIEETSTLFFDKIHE